MELCIEPKIGSDLENTNVEEQIPQELVETNVEEQNSEVKIINIFPEKNINHKHKKNNNNQNNEYYTEYTQNELQIFNNFCSVNQIFKNYYYTRIDGTRKIRVLSRSGNKLITFKNKNYIGDFCTIIYLGEKNNYYGVSKNQNESKMFALKNAFKYNSELKKYAQKYEKKN